MNPPPAPPSFRVLVIDDTPTIHDDFQKILGPPRAPDATEVQDLAHAIFGVAKPAPARATFSVTSALQGQDGLARLVEAQHQGQPYAVAFVDMRMPPGWDGIETVRQLWAADPTLQVVLCTAYSDTSWEETFRQLGDTDSLLVLKKPFDHIEALQLAHTLSKKWAFARQNRERLASLDEAIRQRTAELHSAEERFSRAFDASPLPQAIQDLETGRLIETNAAYEKFSGLPRAQVLGHAPETRGPALDPQRWLGLNKALNAGEPIDEWPFTFSPPGLPSREFRCSGRVVTIGERLCAIWIFRDVTEQIHLEHQLRQAQKMDAVGQLAAGVAHDFNNLLTVILSYGSFVRDHPGLPRPHHSALSQICTAAQRAASLTRQLLVFSRRQITKPEPLDLGATLTSLREMLARLLPERIALQWEYSPDLPRVMADASALEQIVMNLVVNARDAIPDSGIIRLALRTLTLTTADAARHPDARAGQFLCLTVEDNGKGMDATVLTHIFEPFFTTKDIGQGTGLGLSTVYGSVHQHEGWIEVQSTLNLGTLFSVFLPALGVGESLPPVATPTNERNGIVKQGRGERILLVEDEASVRDSAAIIATRAGYHITKASDGPSALQAWTEAAQPFDLLLTDMVMPNGMTGTELALKLRQQRPGLKVILSTGYSEELLKQGANSLDGARLLPKPYAVAEFLDILRETLDADRLAVR